MMAVSLHPDWASGEPACVSAAAFALAPWEAHRRAGPAAGLGVRPVLEPPGERIQAGAVTLFGVLSPPRRHLGLDAVPLAPQYRKRPRHLDVLPGHAGVQALLHQRKAPVVGKPRRAGRRGEPLLLAGRGVQGK